jgi:carbon monoxide dehydrogenase subunit G
VRRPSERLKGGARMADARRMSAIHAVAAAGGIPFSGIDVAFSAGVGVGLLVAAVGARVVISRSRRPARRLVRGQRTADAAPQRAAASG